MPAWLKSIASKVKSCATPANLRLAERGVPIVALLVSVPYLLGHTDLAGQIAVACAVVNAILLGIQIEGDV